MTANRWNDRYLSQLIEFGGTAMTRGEAVRCMQSEGHPQGLIDRWLQGQELAARMRANRERLNVKIIMKPR